MSKIETVGIVGFGQMGKIFLEIFSKRCTVLIFDPRLNTPLKNLCRVDLVIFCVPIQNLEQALTESSAFLKKDAIVLDIASVKEKPAKLMKLLLPKNVSLMGAHPMFGPNSLKGSQRKNIVFCPVRISKEKFLVVKKIFTSLGFKIFTMTPQKHDLAMARSQLLTHLFGQITKNLKIRNCNFAPLSFKLMLKALQMADPNPHFLREMISQNKFAPQIIKEVARQLKNI